MPRPSGVFEITDIPEDKVETVIANFVELEDPPPPKIDKEKQPNGLWTVAATYSDGPEKQKKSFSG